VIFAYFFVGLGAKRRSKPLKIFGTGWVPANLHPHRIPVTPILQRQTTQEVHILETPREIPLLIVISCEIFPVRIVDFLADVQQAVFPRGRGIQGFFRWRYPGSRHMRGYPIRTLGITIPWVPVPFFGPGHVVSFRIKGESSGMAPHLVRLLFQDLNRIDDVIQRKVKFLVRTQRGECGEKSLSNLTSIEDHEDLLTEM
jgi:hypothetical protein